MARKKRYRLKFKIDAKVAIIGGIAAGAVIAVVGAYCYFDHQKKLTALAEANDFSLRSYDLTELVGDNYYVQDGSNYHPLAPGALESSAEHDTVIPEMANPETRNCAFLQDDEQIPTLYKDDKLIYKADGDSADNPIPTEFVFERFYDEGYSIGVRYISNQPDGGKYKFNIDTASIYIGSSICQMDANGGDIVTIDKINGKELTEDKISTSGTIKGLKHGEVYTLDAYVGTEYKGLDVEADTHMFSSYELYKLTEYSMDPNGYMIIDIPDYMWSGYYYVNGKGMFRYINRFKSEGITDIDFNTPYYLGTSDENGEMILNPADNPARTEETESEIISDEETAWKYNISIDNQQKTFGISVSYSDARTYIDGKLVKASSGAEIEGVEEPAAVLVSPTGKRFDLEVAEEENGAAKLHTEIDNPESGTWVLEITGMYARVFSVDSMFEGSSTNRVVKDGDADAEMTVYLSRELENGQFTFTWDDINHAGTFEMEDSNHNKYGNLINPESVVSQTYGNVVLNVGHCLAGEYKVLIKGESLGHVYFSYEDLGTAENQENQENGTEENAEAAGDESTAAEDNAGTTEGEAEVSEESQENQEESSEDASATAEAEETTSEGSDEAKN